MTVFVKSIAVIDSCNNISQIKTANKYINIASKKRYIDWDSYELLLDRLDDKKTKIIWGEKNENTIDINIT